MVLKTTLDDLYIAVAEPRRRDIIKLLAGGIGNRGLLEAGEAEQGQGVNSLAARLRLPQPTVSKHLRVLREAGIVSVNKRGRQRLYRLNPMGLKPAFDWVAEFEHFWASQLQRIKQRAERSHAQRQKRSSITN